MAPNFEVYQLEREVGDLTEPIYTVLTQAKGLNATVYKNDLLYVGFMCSMDDFNCIVKIYDFQYELQNSIRMELSDSLFNDMAFMLNDRFLIGAHTDGIFSVINIEHQTARILENPIGNDIENVWGICAVEMDAPQLFYAPTTNGLYELSLNDDGQFVYAFVSFFNGTNVTNAIFINEDEMLVSLQTGQENKMVIFNLDTHVSKVIIDPENGVYCMDICKIPQTQGMDPYFIIHSGKGLTLINVRKGKTYDLAFNDQENFNVCRSIQVMEIEQGNPDAGFWLAQIDNGVVQSGENPDDRGQKIKAFDFDAAFMSNLC